MLYLVTPAQEVLWWDMPGIGLEQIQEYNLDISALEWQPAEARSFSNDLLRIALRHGVATPHGIAVDVRHTVDLGRADQLRIGQQAIDELQQQIRANSGHLMENLMPGWTQAGHELDERVRSSTERSAKEAEEDLASVLAASVKPDLADHWARLDGHLPEPT